MPNWERLAEARIQEWLHRPPRDRLSLPHDGPLIPLETQLLAQALELAREAGRLPTGPERTQLERQELAVETRLLILLEREKRPLAAQRVSELLSLAKAQRPTHL